MFDITNPLAEVGVPEWMVRQAIQDGPEALERLRKHIRNLIGATGRVYHPDVFKNDPHGTYLRVANAAESLTTADEIEAWAGFLLDPDSASAEERERLQELAAKREAAKRRALLDMLGVVDQFQVAGFAAEGELLFGLPALSYGVAMVYDSTYLLRLRRHVTQLVEISHPPGFLPSFSSDVSWNAEQNAWGVPYFAIDPDGMGEPVLKTHYHRELNDTQVVQLVGAVSADALPHLYELAYPQQEGRRALTGAPHGMATSIEPFQAAQILWFDPDQAWWMEVLSPRLHVGDYGVIMRPATGELALAGELLATRLL